MKKLITCLSVFVLSGAAFATTWTVDDDGKADFDNIQAAVDAAEPRGGEREIMPCDLGPTIAGYRGVMGGTLWPAGLVYYDFDASISQLNRDRTRAAMDLLEAAAGTVFIPRTNEPNYIHIIEAGGNWSYVGMLGGSQDLSMYNWSYPFIICHELIHALGRLHQQSRSDRDDYITVNWDCIDGGNGNNNYNICNQCPNYGEYDFESVMHYSQWSFSTGCPTMTCLPGYEEYQDVMGQRDYLSDGDIETLQFMYPSSPGACCSETGTCIEASEYQCENDGWNWQGVGTYCVDGCLQNELGACCIKVSQACIELYEPPCIAGGGVWLGPLTVCVDEECVFGCEGDINTDGEVNVSDLLEVIDQWGNTSGSGDVNTDGIVDVSDLLIVVGNWGPCP